MRIALVVTRMNETNLRRAAQVGVTDIVGRYPGPRLEHVVELKQRVERYGMRLSVIEGHIPHNQVVHGGPGRAEQLETFANLLRHMGEAGVPICCYNFMTSDDWARTSTTTPHRGGALVTAFDADQAEAPSAVTPITAEQLWENLRVMLETLVPVAESSGVSMAMHPDDPPIAEFRGHEQIMHSLESFERLARLVPSPANGICFCQGCFAEMGEDVPAAIVRLGPYIRYVHFRDICGCATDFRETFHDDGQTDMAAAIGAYRQIGFNGPMRPDHVPVLAGEAPDMGMDFTQPPTSQIDADTFNGPDVPVPPGYTMLGRLYAVGYMRGLIEAASR
ncbi:MAG: mannonate dehydratase [Phycisphaeraceae bacterium]|nr:mannonate dehydratase [Phycisphaeraceae bacterium]